MLFQRSDANPILTAADVPYPRQLGLQPGGGARRRRDDPARCGSRTCAGISQLHVARSARRRHRLAVRPGAAAPLRRRAPPRGDLGLRGSAADLAARARGVGDRLHGVQPPRPARLARDDPRLPDRPPARAGHAARGQGRGALPAPHRRPLGDDPPTVAAPRRRAHVDLVLAGPAPLGRPHAAARGARRRLVGCRQDRPRPAAARDRRGLAGHVPRRPRDRRRPDLPGRPRAARPRGPARRPATGRDEWVFGPARAVRAHRRRRARSCSRAAGSSTRPTDRLRIYYGAADSSIGLATATFSEVLALVREAPGPS